MPASKQKIESTTVPMARLPSDLESDRLLNIKHLCAALSLSESRIYELIAEGKLDRPIKLSARCSRWKASSVREFIANLSA